MGSTPKPNYHGRQLIRGLKTLRERSGLTQHEAGDRLSLTLQKVSRIENGQLPGYHEMRAMLDLYGLPEPDWTPYLDLWKQARKRNWWQKYHLDDPSYIRMEDEASSKYEFQLGHIPTLLQIENYARRALTRRTRLTRVTEELAVRMRLQDRLHSDQTLRLHALVHEPVLHQGIDRPQLIHLATAAELPNITLQIVPQTTDLHDGLHGSTVLLSFDDPDEPDIAFTETLLGLTQSQDTDQVTTIRDTLDHIAATAMTPEQSTALIRTLATTQA